MQNIKIVVIGKKNYLHWDDHVVDGFRAHGCKVFHFQSNVRPVSLQLARGILKLTRSQEKAKALGNRQHAAWLYRKIQSIRPDLVFFTSGVLISLEYFRMFRELPGTPLIAAWDGDGAPGYESSRDYVPYIDHLFETDLQYVKENKLGFRHIHHLPFCANPGVHRNLGKEREQKIYFCGAWTPARDQVLDAVRDYPVVLKGWNWDRLTNQGANIEITPGTVPIGQQVNDYNRYQVVLNIHQAENNHYGCLNMRTFEAPACGATLMCDFREELPLAFDMDAEVLVYRSVEELQEKIDRCRKDIGWAGKIAERGYRRVLQQHTYSHRMGDVLTTLFS